MSRIVTFTHVTLDGVMQAPGRPDEDTRGGFAHGGWAVRYNDAVMAGDGAEGMASGGALLLGRRTYEDFYGFWPKQPRQPVHRDAEAHEKYVASTTLREPLPWENSILLGATRSTRSRAEAAADKDLVVARQRRARAGADRARPRRRVHCC